jgi:hypothetical protein
MNEPNSDSLCRQIEAQYRRVQGLRMAVYEKPDPSVDTGLYQQLATEEARLHALEQQRKEARAAERTVTPPRAQGRLLGPETTGLGVETTLRMQPVPTGIYHLFDAETDPLVTVTVHNKSDDRKRVCVKVYIETLSARAVSTVELDRGEEKAINLLPALLPARARAVEEVQRATLHIVIDILADLDPKKKPTPAVLCESHNTFPIVCLARTSSFNTVRRPDTGEWVDLTHYYGAWVTPHAETVQALIRRAADLLPRRGIWGYQGSPESVEQQVAALYGALKQAGITYVNSVIDFGSPQGHATQRTRLPRESVALKSANCIDGTVLMASLLEGASLSPALVLIPGHAFVGWETWDGSDQWRFLETTMIAESDFAAACVSGQRQYENCKKYNGHRLIKHKVTELRTRGIWPME